MPMACLAIWVAVYLIKWMYKQRDQSDKKKK